MSSQIVLYILLNFAFCHKFGHILELCLLMVPNQRVVRFYLLKIPEQNDYIFAQCPLLEVFPPLFKHFAQLRSILPRL